MARCKFGSLVTVGVGKLGGHVFQRNPYGVSIRTGYSSDGRTFLYFPQIPELFQIARERWAAAPEPDKIEWGKLGERFPIPDWDGDNRYLTGKQFHDRTTIHAIQQGELEPINPFSYNNAIPYFEPIAAYWAVTSNNFVIIYDPFPTFQNLKVSSWGGFDHGQDHSSHQYVFLAYYNGNATNIPIIGAVLQSRYGTPPTGFEIWLQLVSVSSSGVSSLPKYYPLEILYS